MKTLPGICAALLAPSVMAAPPTFEDVAPIFEQHCNACHDGWFAKAGVDLGDLESIREGGRSGPLVVPGDPDKGWLMYSITRATGKQRMPPDGQALSADELDTLRRWIEAGAN